MAVCGGLIWLVIWWVDGSVVGERRVCGDQVVDFKRQVVLFGGVVGLVS